MAADHFCLRWNNYQSNMVSELDSLRSDEDLVDVTLSCEGQLLKAHKVILSACSSYFRSVFKDNPCKHPVVILKDVNYEDVEALLNFVYQGVVYISEKKLTSFLQTAELLQIRGLTGAATTIKEASYGDTTTVQNKMADRNSVPPPPQLLTANVINSWKQQGMLNTAPASLKSPELPLMRYRSQDCSENDSDVSVVKKELPDPDARAEDDCNSIDDILREESSREGNPSFYDNIESDETEEETGEVKNKEMNPNATSSNLFGIIANYAASQSSIDPNFSASESKWKCMLPQECRICHKTFSNAGNLRQHITNVHTPGHPVRCELCSKEFKNKEYLRKHKVIIHKVPLRKHKVFSYNPEMLQWNYWAAQNNLHHQ